MIVSIRAALAGAVLSSLTLASTAHADPCGDDARVEQSTQIVGTRFSFPAIEATAQGLVVSWHADGWESAVVEHGVATSRSASPSMPQAVAFAPGVRLAIDNGGNALGAQRFTASGTPIGDRIPFGTTATGHAATAAFDGAHFVVAWTDPAPAPERGYDLSAMIVETSGVVHAPVHLGRAYETTRLHSVRTGDVTWILWTGSPEWGTDDVFGVRLDASGAVLDDAPVHLSEAPYVVATTSRGDDALIAVIDGYERREVVRLDAAGAGPAVDVSALGFANVVAVTADPRGDGYLLWARPTRSASRVNGYPLLPTGASSSVTTFASLSGAVAIAFDGHDLRYAAIEESPDEGFSRIRTGRISDAGVVEPDSVLVSEEITVRIAEQCVPTGLSEGAFDSVDDDGCGGCQIAPGATSAAMVLVGVLVMTLPRRRRR